MTTVIAFIVMFGLLVFIHELGHLILAKKTGMLAREFAIGFGPKIFSTIKNETLYTVRLLPIGGYVRVAGDDPEMIELKPGYHIGIEFNESKKINKIIVNHKDKHPNARVIEVERADLDHDLVIEGYEPEDEDNKLTFEVDPKAYFVMDETETQIAPYDRQFASKSVGQRAAQLFAGPFMNFLLAIVIFILIGLIQGVPSDDAVIANVKTDSPADEAGFEAGDEITHINGSSITSWEDFSTIVSENPKKELSMTFVRGDEEKSLTVVPDEVDMQDQTIGQVGVEREMDKSFGQAVKFGFVQPYELTKMILTNLGMLITGQVSIDMLSGPVGIYDFTDQVVQTGFMNFMTWTALLSVNLGIVNLVPLPALDGGRLLFVGIEAVRGKPIDPQKEGIVHFIGFALLMLLMIVVTWNDIQRLFL
ncbi:MAG TPA: RIP metalloprotease RseP [Virgibacillus sp.]|nr:RIP metalloprotease RseP [Virgibacillus sp.]